ncbi:ATP-dependent RNA helicase, partial [Coemansia nantahalensis]
MAGAQRARAGKRQRQRGPQTAAASAEESWAATTLNPPPIPDAQGRPAPKAAEAARARKKRKVPGAAKPDRAAAGEPADAECGIGAVAEWSWEDVAMPTYIAGGDNDIGGVVSLQEVDGIDCVWEDDESTGGRVLKFRKGKASKKPRKRGTALARPAPPPAADADSDDDVVDLDDAVNWDDFVPVDDFTEEKAKSGELVSIGALMRNAAAEQAESDDGEEPASGSEGGDEEPASGSEGEDEVPEDDSEGEDEAPEDDAEDDGEEPAGDDKDPDVDVSAWEQLGVHPDLLRALRHLGFSEPTEIQSKTLPSALQGHDVIGAAETGSGKTLAFGIPMLQHVSGRQGAWAGPAGLVLTPTRELAIQVKDHLAAMARFNKARVV